MDLFTKSFSTLFERDLLALIKQLSLYKSEEDMWKITGDIKNSGGNLALHIVGNLRFFFGNILGGGDYVRERDNEFALKNVSKEKIIIDIEKAIEEIKTVLSDISEQDLEKIFPIKVLGYEMTTAYFISHLYGHLNYHLGQLNYHRRLVS